MKYAAFFLFMIGLFISQAYASETMEINCEGPELHYVNRFDMKTTVLVNQENQEGASLTMKVTKAGYDTETVEMTVEDLKVVVKKVNNPNLHSKEFYVIQYRSQKDAENKFFANIVVGFPGLMTSYVKFEGLRTYKSTCK